MTRQTVLALGRITYSKFQITQNAQVIFKVAVESIVGNGEGIPFWSNRWLRSNTVSELGNWHLIFSKQFLSHKTAPGSAGFGDPP